MTSPFKSKKSGRKFIKRLLLGLLALSFIYCGYYFWTHSLHTVVPGEIYRSGQPSAAQLENWITQKSIRTILNLRGIDSPDHAMEENLASNHAIQLEDVSLSAYRAIAPQRLIRILDILETAPRPILIHCRDGIDRSRTIGALAAWLSGTITLDAACRNAYVIPGPWKTRKGGDHISRLFEDYRNWCAEHQESPDNTQRFKTWAHTIYHPGYYHVLIDGPPQMTGRTGEMLTIDLQVKNASSLTIPVDNPDHPIELYSLINGPADPLKTFTRLPAYPLPPGKTISLNHNLTCPDLPGSYTVTFDLREVKGTAFSRRGSPVLACTLIVKRQ